MLTTTAILTAAVLLAAFATLAYRKTMAAMKHTTRLHTCGK
jgi:hypothetical protein